MNIKDLEQLELENLLKHSNGEEELVYPADVKPLNIKEYPLAIATSEKFMRLCRARAKILKEQLQFKEDSYLSAIEDEQILVKPKTTLKPAIYKPKFSSEAKRERELRKQLYLDEDYQTKKTAYEQWDERRADWITYINKLRREYDLLQIDYNITGGV